MKSKAEDFAAKTAAAKGWVLQTSAEFLNTVTDGLATNRERHGYYLCPCREGWGEKQKDRDIICPCEYAGPDIEEFGQCYCGLYISEEKACSGEAPTAIPDRRPEELYPD